MLKYLIILLDDNSISYCHYNSNSKNNLMSLDILKQGIMFAMKNDLRIQYVLPKYELSHEYIELINSMFHDNIGPIEQDKLSSIVVIDGLKELERHENLLESTKRYILRASIQDFFDNYNILKQVFSLNISVNVSFTDVDSFTDDKIEEYKSILNDIAEHLRNIINKGNNVNTNILTDRIVLDNMNNCGAGESSITLAPDGNFYSCPAFYYEKDEYSILGNLDEGLKVVNHRLFTINGSPLCKKCDAYHCKRCVWLNKKLTYELNTPSHQQCVMSHIERNASKKMLDYFHQSDLLKNRTIESIDYLDPFDVYNQI